MKKENLFEIKNNDNKELLKVESDGTVYHLGRKIDVDKELARVFGECLIMFVESGLKDK